METLRKHLGSHHGLRPGQLHKEEVAALVMRAGRVASLIVRMEARARAGGRHAFDCGWFSPSSGKLLVGWEFDGQDAGDRHIAGNRSKFDDCAALRKVQVLYSVKNDLTPKPASRRQIMAGLLPGVCIVADEELMAPGGIEEWISAAQGLDSGRL